MLNGTRLTRGYLGVTAQNNIRLDNGYTTNFTHMVVIKHIFDQLPKIELKHLCMLNHRYLCVTW